jgi:hypothetical protein
MQTAPLDPGIEQELFSPGKAEGQTPGTGREGVDARDQKLQEQLRRELGAAAIPEESNPLVEIAAAMRQSEGLIARNDSGPQTQGLQRKIVSDLERLIQQARSRCQASSPSPEQKQPVASRQPVQQPPEPGKSPKPGQSQTSPARDSNATAGRGEVQRLNRDVSRSILQQTQTWGELPPAAREQMLELWSEEFLPKYQAMIEDYFKRLAEEPQR